MTAGYPGSEECERLFRLRLSRHVSHPCGGPGKRSAVPKNGPIAVVTAALHKGTSERVRLPGMARTSQAEPGQASLARVQLRDLAIVLALADRWWQGRDVCVRVADVRERVARSHRGFGTERLVLTGPKLNVEAVSAAGDAEARVGGEVVVRDRVVVRAVDQVQSSLQVGEVAGVDPLAVECDADRAGSLGLAVLHSDVVGAGTVEDVAAGVVRV